MPTPPWPFPRVLAHRGGGTLAPENTIEAIEVGRAHGYRAVEFDATLAADGVAVLLHDDTLDRTTSGQGAVAARMSAELAALDAGAWHSPRFAGARVPRLDAVIRHCRTHGVWMNIELKPAPGAATLTGRVVAECTAHLFADAIVAGGDRAERINPAVPLFSSFERAAVDGARAAAPDIPRGYLLDTVPSNWQEELQALGCVALHTNHLHLTRALAQAIKEAGYWLFCYTVNDPARAEELLGWGVDAFCTDRIDLLFLV
ncbi:MAG: glycerophosphodiester phosphodiesterase [Burkholderiales bacterium]|nr:glycerophosphodiester phosphodiesterase [Burkholderiales bacterium]